MQEIQSMVAKEMKLLKKKKYKHAVVFYIFFLLATNFLFLLNTIINKPETLFETLAWMHLVFSIVATIFFYLALYLLNFFHIPEHIERAHTNKLLADRKTRQEKIEHQKKLLAHKEQVTLDIATEREILERNVLAKTRNKATLVNNNQSERK